MVFAEFLEKNCPGGGVLVRFFAPGVGISHFYLGLRVGNSFIQKIPQGFPGGDGQAWN